MKKPFKKIPIINVGKYAGTPIDKLPNSYLRWMVGQKFPKEWLDVAIDKLSKSEHSDVYMSVSRHAIDMYSKRFLNRWLKEDASVDGDGLATHIVKKAKLAWENGVDASKNRHQDDGIIKEHEGIRFVFGVNPDYPEYKDVITIMDMEG